MVGINIEMDEETNAIVEGWSKEKGLHNKRRAVIELIKERGMPPGAEEDDEDKEIEDNDDEEENNEEEELEYARFDG